MEEIQKDYPKCKICGQPVEIDRYSFSPKEIMGQKMKEGFCFHCSHFIEVCSDKNWNQNSFVAEGASGTLGKYQGGVADKKKNKGFLGFGGHPFLIHFLDGRERDYRIFNNTWYAGDIPKHLQGLNIEHLERLNKNAEIITDKQYYKWLQTWIEKNNLKTGDIVLGYNSNGLTGIYLYNSFKKLFYYFDKKERRFDEKAYYQIIDPFKVTTLQKMYIDGIPLDKKNKVILEKEYTEEEKKRLFNPYRGSLL